MAEITGEMRSKLRAPLPPLAVSQHPTKTYLSSIKSIYVAERINDVFGVGSWTLKSKVIERLDKFVVVKAILEIPSAGFYGEAYGGNDNVDIGDAYKGATTDGFTKIAGVQLEIGIDVFKGISTDRAERAESSTNPQQTPEHWCEEHQVKFFKSVKMKSFAHPIEGTTPAVWCHEHKPEILPDAPESTESGAEQESSSFDLMAKVRQVRPALKTDKNVRDWLVVSLKFTDERIDTEPEKVWAEVRELL